LTMMQVSVVIQKIGRIDEYSWNFIQHGVEDTCSNLTKNDEFRARR